MASFGVMGIGGAETPTLLWTNPNPTSAFDAQTLNIDLTDYEYLMFEVKGALSNSYTTPYTSFIVCEKSEGYTNIGGAFYSNGNYTTQRLVAIHSMDVSFGAGRNSSGQESNSLSIPIKIYGLKKSLI